MNPNESTLINDEKRVLHEPYELTKIDLTELKASVKTDAKGFFYVEINNEEYRFKIISPHLRERDELRMIIKYMFFKEKLKRKEIRYCKECETELIVDKRPFVDVCERCLVLMNEPEYLTKEQLTEKNTIMFLKQHKPEEMDNSDFYTGDNNDL
jgi:hypothetical protein